MKKNIVFLNGKWIKADAVILQALTPGIVRGRGVFETMHALNGEVIFLVDHLERLQRGLSLYTVRFPYSKKKIMGLLDLALKKNKLKTARVRLSVFKQDKQLITNIIVLPIKKLTDQDYKKGYKGVISSVVRPKTKYSHIKSMDYRVFHEALYQARSKGYDEAILFNDKKELVEGATTNIFIVKKDKIFTPAIKCGCLNGIIRQFIIELLQIGGFQCKVGTITKAQLKSADEVFLTNSLLGVMALSSINGKKIANGREGNITYHLRIAYASAKV